MTLEATASSGSSPTPTCIRKLEAAEAEERRIGAASAASLVLEAEENVTALLEHGLVAKLTAVLGSADDADVVVAAAGALRNLSMAGDAALQALDDSQALDTAMVVAVRAHGHLSRLLDAAKQGDADAAENVKRCYGLLGNTLALAWNMAESSPAALAKVSRSEIISAAAFLLLPEAQANIELRLVVANFLYVATDANAALARLMRDGGVLDILTTVVADATQTPALRVLLAGVLASTAGDVAQVQEAIVVPTIVAGLASDASDAVARRVALEVLTNMLTTLGSAAGAGGDDDDDEWEDMSDEEDGKAAPGAPAAATAALDEAAVQRLRALIDAAKLVPTALALVQTPEASDDVVQVRTFAFLTNYAVAFGGDAVGGAELWTHVMGLTGALVDAGRTDALEAAAGLLCLLLEQAKSTSPDAAVALVSAGAGFEKHAELVLRLCRADIPARVRVHTIGLLSSLAARPFDDAFHTQVLLALLVGVAEEPLNAPLACASLDAIFDRFAEPECNAPVAKLGMMDRLAAAVPRLTAAVDAARRAPKRSEARAHLTDLKAAASDVKRFIEYKRGQPGL